MTTTPVEDSPSTVVAFRDTRWKTRWLVVGIVVLLVWRSVGFVDREWLSQLPYWLVFITIWFATEAFFLIFPILTRDPNCRPKVGIPARRRWLIEFGIAIPIVIGTIFVLAAINYVVGRLSPGSSLTPDSVRDMATSPNHTYVYLTLLFMFTLAPVAEEVFFRGFLYNAFRTRMPVLVAGLVQSVFFGLAHFYSAMQIGVVVLFGLLLTAVYEWRKTLLTPILIHCGVNFIAALGAVAMMAAHASSPVMGVFGDPNDTKCIIRQVTPNSPAEEAGLQAGDIIMSFNGEPIRDFPHLVETVPLYRPGDAIPVTIKRSDSELEVTVVLRRRGEP